MRCRSLRWFLSEGSRLSSSHLLVSKKNSKLLSTVSPSLNRSAGCLTSIAEVATSPSFHDRKSLTVSLVNAGPPDTSQHHGPLACRRLHVARPARSCHAAFGEMLLRCLCLYIRCGFCLWPNLKDTTMSFSGKNGARPIMFSTRFCRALSRCPNLDRNVGSICGCSPFLKLNHTRVQVRHQLGRLSRGIEDHQDENSETQANSPQRNTFRRNAAGGHLAGLQSLRRAVCEVRLQHPCSNNQVFLTFLAMQGYFFNAAQYKGFSTRLLPAPSRDTTYDRGPGASRAHPVKRSAEAPSLSSHAFVCCLSKYVSQSFIAIID